MFCAPLLEQIDRLHVALSDAIDELVAELHAPLVANRFCFQQIFENRADAHAEERPSALARDQHKPPYRQATFVAADIGQLAVDASNRLFSKVAPIYRGKRIVGFQPIAEALHQRLDLVRLRQAFEELPDDILVAFQDAGHCLVDPVPNRLGGWKGRKGRRLAHRIGGRQGRNDKSEQERQGNPHGH